MTQRTSAIASPWPQYRLLTIPMLTADDFERDFVVMNFDYGDKMFADVKDVTNGQFKFNGLHARPP